MKVGIVGLGLIGGSIGLKLKDLYESNLYEKIITYRMKFLKLKKVHPLLLMRQ